MSGLVIFLASIGGYCLGRALVAVVLHLFFDRSGNSGRNRHWTEE